MKVTLINYTQDAARLLAFTKATRLNLTPALMLEIAAWSPEKLEAELNYMATTIKSSWEFVTLVFLVEGVTRACAQQMTRTRNASYAMQSQRVTDARAIAVTNPFYPDTPEAFGFDEAAAAARNTYSTLVDMGAKLEDARGVLPMNTQCNLVVKYDLRALTDLVKARKSLRAQGEYHDVVMAYEAETLRLWSWAAPFFKSDKQTAIDLLEQIAQRIGITVGKGEGWEIAKAIDLIRKE